MIKVNVKSTWHEMIAVREKYIKEAKETKQDLLVECGGERMLIKYQILDQLKVKMAEPVKVKDKFSDEIHELIYFLWKPNLTQPPLL